MSRLQEKFDELKGAGQKGFIPFITAGDPDLETSLEIILKLDELGADILEIGVPFSDPMADGPVIQRSSERALERGTTFEEVLDLSIEVRKLINIPLVLFTYYNPFLKFGIEKFCRFGSGFDGVLLTDVIGEEARKISDRVAYSGIDLISLVAPTTDDRRLERICAHAHGFLYAVSHTGVTGSQAGTSSQAELLVNRTRKFTELPIAVGFGISTAEQVTDVWRYADAAVVGSAIVAEIERASESAEAVAGVQDLMGRLVPRVAKTGSEN